MGLGLSKVSRSVFTGLCTLILQCMGMSLVLVLHQPSSAAQLRSHCKGSHISVPSTAVVCQPTPTAGLVALKR